VPIWTAPRRRSPASPHCHRTARGRSSRRRSGRRPHVLLPRLHATQAHGLGRLEPTRPSLHQAPAARSPSPIRTRVSGTPT
jgi:hypothetical protein